MLDVLAVLETHWLDGIECDHESKRDNPRCACSEVFLGWHPTVGDAVKAWIAHVANVAGGTYDGSNPKAE